MRKITVESGAIAGIPVIITAPEQAKGCPLVFYIHGHLGDKTSGMQLAYLLADRNIICVCLDAWLHGDRFDESIFAKADGVYPEETGLDVFYRMFEVVQQTANDVAKLLEHFRVDQRVDASRVGAAGVSMGAFTTFYLAAHSPDIQVAVPLLGFAAFAKRWQDVTLEASSYPNWEAAMQDAAGMTEEKLQFMQVLDPFPRMHHFAPKPLLMFSGDLDTDAPKLYNVNLFRELKPHYASHPDHLRLSIYDYTDHRVTSSMLRETAGWFAKYLGM